MAQAQVRYHVGVGNESIGVQKAQRGRLDRAAQIQRATFKRLRQIRDDHVAHLVARRAVEHQAERAFGIMLADNHHCALKERAAQLPAVEQQLAFQEFRLRCHKAA